MKLYYQYIPSFRVVLILFLLFTNPLNNLFAEIRYVSKTGSSTPPFLTWETAADSIMEAINICHSGDTIYVANGLYHESVVMIPGLALIGAGMDSCIINSTGVLYYAVKVTDSCYLTGFQLQAPENGILVYDSTIPMSIVIIENNKITNTRYGIDISGTKYKLISKNIISDTETGIYTSQANPTISENVIYINNNIGEAIYNGILGRPHCFNNIIICQNAGTVIYGSLSLYENNLIYGKGTDGIWSYSDTFRNNVIHGTIGFETGIFGANSQIINNSVEKTVDGIWYDVQGGPPPVIKYNNLFNNFRNSQNITLDSTNISYDPMFANPDSLDFHLQKYSPLIDAGDPMILDQDGSRSDIGLFGGPYGESYTYRDLAPGPPSNLTAVYDSGFVRLRWNKNTEADFLNYRIYRDTLPDFMYDSTRLIGVTADSFYYDDLPEKYIAMNYYYKITAIDSTGHQSAPSEEVHLNITGAAEGPPVVVEHYQLLNNYPNPFNSSTMIPYRLKEPGYVKLYIYDIKGEVVSLLVNDYQQAGYYEVRFNPTAKERKQGETGQGWWTGYNDDIATGIYLYQIMVRGEGNIPVFTDMGKMILLK